MQFLAAATAALLFLHPSTGASGDIREPAAGHLNGRFSGFAVVFSGAQGVLIGVVFQLPGLQLPLLATGGEVLALPLEFLALLLVEAGLAFQFATAGVEASQFRLNRQQLVLT